MNIEEKIDDDDVWYSVMDSLRNSVEFYVNISICDSVDDNMWLSVWARVKSSVGDSILVSVRNTVENVIKEYEY